MKTFLSAKAFASMAIMLQGISASQYLIDPVSCAGAKGDFVDKAIQGAFAVSHFPILYSKAPTLTK